MTLKINKEHYELLKTEFNKIHNVNLYKDYQDKKLTDIRYVWDVLWSMKLRVEIIDNMYDYLNDTHITSALIKILKESND